MARPGRRDQDPFDTVTPVRVRFAPSPTGYLHVGGARTALFNWLLARRTGGTFVLRIEDTDAERSSTEMVDGILEGLRWLGLDWDEGPVVGGPCGPYFQSERRDRHQAMAADLVARGKAYYCYCTPEELAARREIVEAGGSGGAWKYDRRCRQLTPQQIAVREAAKTPRAVRFLVPEGPIRFDDLVHGPIEFDAANVEDFVILRSDGQPTYHLSVVSDDVEMRMTHVVRGDDHISNTPKQVLLYRAAGVEAPRFAHVPLILGADKKRLSKRHGATSVMEYARQGYLPEAVVNFLALLGWSPGSGDRELFTRDELAEIFDLGGIGGGSAVFNVDKLDWFNQQYLARLAPEALALGLKPWFDAAGLWDADLVGARRGWFVAVLELLRPRAKRLDEFVPLGRFLFSDDMSYDPAALEKHLRPAGVRGHLEAIRAAYSTIDAFDATSLEATLRAVADARALKAGTLIHVVRVAVTGRTVSPGLFDVLALLGRDRVDHRLAAAEDLAG